jgi:hypothetical protein
MSETQLNSRMTDALTICNALDQAVQTLTLRDESRWAAWMCYLLSALEQQASSPRTYQAFLRNLQEHIGVRLERGGW